MLATLIMLPTVEPPNRKPIALYKLLKSRLLGGGGALVGGTKQLPQTNVAPGQELNWIPTHALAGAKQLGSQFTEPT